MKTFLFSLCILALTSYISANLIKVKLQRAISSTQDDFETCAEETNLTLLEWYTEDEILNITYTEAENQERTRKHGCLIECLLKKADLMEGSNIKEAKVHSEIDRKMGDRPEVVEAQRLARKCMKEVKDITQECEKGFYLLVCGLKYKHEQESIARNKIQEELQ